MNPKQREAALRLADGPRTSGVLWGRAVVALLRELAAEPQGEPVAYIHAWKLHANVIGRTLHWQATSPHGDDVEVTSLYAHPPQQRKPLTEEQVFASQNLMDLNGRVLGLAMPKLMEVIRAIERAHGIGEAP